VVWSGGARPGDEFVANLCGQAVHQLKGELLVLVHGEAHAQAELRVVLEEAVGPGGAAAILVGSVGRGGQVAAVDAGAARGIGDEGAVAEELGEQLDIGRLAAAGAGTAVFEQGLQELGALHVHLHRGAVHFGEIQEEAVVGGFGLAERNLGHHVDGLVLGIALVLHGTDLDAEVQPVQSSGATWMVYFWPLYSGPL